MRDPIQRRINAALAVAIGVCLVHGAGQADSGGASWEESRRNGAVARDQGRYPDARRWLETALTQAFEPAELRRADLDDEIAGVCQILGDQPAAERYYVDALSILDKHPGDGAGVRSIVLAGLGLFRARQGRVDEAKDILEKALASGKQVFGPKDIRMASLQSSLGQLYLMQGRVVDAKPLLHSAVEIQKTGPPSSASDRVVAETTLAAAYMMEGRYPEAESLLREASETAQKLGENHPGYAGALATLADLYRLEGYAARGEPLLRKAQAIYQAAFGPASSKVAEILLDRSVDSLAAKKPSLAEEEIRSALDILRKADGAEHPTVALAELRLAQAYTFQNKFAEAEPLLRHALSIQEKTYPEGHTLVADCMLQLGEVERLQHHYPDAEMQYQKAIAMYERVGNPGSPGLSAALRQYAKLLRTSRTEEAKALERRAQEKQKAVQAFK